MARRIRSETAVAVRGIRALQVAEFRRRLDGLPESTEVYDFGLERDQLVERIAGLERGGRVHVQAFELAGELVAVAGLRSRFDQAGPKCFRFEGDQLIPEDYERVGPIEGQEGPPARTLHDRLGETT